jgi:hypothetical protein
LNFGSRLPYSVRRVPLVCDHVADYMRDHFADYIGSTLLTACMVL